MCKVILKYLYSFVFSFFGIILLLYPSTAAKGISNAIIVCTDVVIPSLFPFTACILFLMRCGIGDFLKKLESISLKIFHQNIDMLTVMLFSLIGGYPVGAKLSLIHI